MRYFLYSLSLFLCLAGQAYAMEPEEIQNNVLKFGLVQLKKPIKTEQFGIYNATNNSNHPASKYLAGHDLSLVMLWKKPCGSCINDLMKISYIMERQQKLQNKARRINIVAFGNFNDDQESVKQLFKKTNIQNIDLKFLIIDNNNMDSLLPLYNKTLYLANAKGHLFARVDDARIDQPEFIDFLRTIKTMTSEYKK